MNVQNADFSQRIARIQAGKTNNRTTVFVGQDETFTHHGRLGPPVKAVKKVQGSGPLGTFTALLVGLLAVGLVRYGVYRATGVDRIVIDTSMNWYLNGAAALIVALILARFVVLRRFTHKVYLAVGVLVGISTFHNLVHFQPQLFARIFTPEWVSTVTTLTPENSIMFRGSVVGT